MRNGQRAMDIEWQCEVDRKMKTGTVGPTRERNRGLQLRDDCSSYWTGEVHPHDSDASTEESMSSNPSNQSS